ncbi:cysteine desulfurase family protein [Oceanivirga salmonicida]|uniref:cysteine desulfurase family protein n=1 Tax=Oceanivirga salmonicida TaxID=1769291 RepID=UPI0008332BE8|nr:cysteine desulfurase family protein [Oceanivirga salmonicida]
MTKIYFDNAATTKVNDEVINTMLETMKNYYANADSTHDMGLEIAKKIRDEKKIFENLLGLKKENIYFTAGGGDANNIIINSIVSSHKKGHIISTKIEHPSVLETIKNLENNYDISYVNVDNYGFVNETELKNLIREDTILVSISFVNSELGTIQNIEKLSNMVKEINKNTIFHTDFVQGLGHINVNFSKLKVDAISFSSHKIYGPKGIGAMYINPDIKFKKSIYGSNTENHLVPRTMPNELVLGFLKAINLIDYFKLQKMQELKEYCMQELLKIKNVRINSPENSSPSILNVAFKNIKGEVILNYLSANNIYISTGSACSSKKGVSNVIKEINLDKEYINGVIRISFSIENTKNEVDIMIKHIKEIVEMI